MTRLADPEIEAAIELARASLARMGVSGPEQAAITIGIRRRYYGSGERQFGGNPDPRSTEEPGGPPATGA